MRIGSVVIDCRDFETMFRFCRDALRCVPREEPEDAWVVLCDPRERERSLNRVPQLPGGAGPAAPGLLHAGPIRWGGAPAGAGIDTPPAGNRAGQGFHGAGRSGGEPVLRG